MYDAAKVDEVAEFMQCEERREFYLLLCKFAYLDGPDKRKRDFLVNRPYVCVSHTIVSDSL